MAQKKRALLLGAIALFCAAALLIGIPLLVRFASGTHSAVAAKNSVVYVFCTWVDPETGDSVGASGTGFAVGKPNRDPEYFITNNHVIEDARAYNGQILIVYSGASNDTVAPRVVEASAEKDIAILKIPQPTNKRTPLTLRRSAGVDVGEKVYALGYPGVSTRSTDTPPIDLDDISMTSGIVSKKTALSFANVQAYEMDVAIHGGNSGGPLVDESGNAIGINTFGLKDTENMNFAIFIDELLPFLRTLEIPHTVQGANDWVLLLCGGFALLCIASGALLLVMRQRQFAGIAGGAQSAGKAPLPAGPGTRQPVLRGVSGKYAGSKMELAGRRITIGRDASKCNLVFEGNVPGVSAQHCAVSFDRSRDVFVLEDLGSTYGTFLDGGQKVTANVPVTLRAGDSFYLANPENRFVVGLE